MLDRAIVTLYSDLDYGCKLRVSGLGLASETARSPFERNLATPERVDEIITSSGNALIAISPSSGMREMHRRGKEVGRMKSSVGFGACPDNVSFLLAPAVPRHTGYSLILFAVQLFPRRFHERYSLAPVRRSYLDIRSPHVV